MTIQDIINTIKTATDEEKKELRGLLASVGVKRVSGELVRRSELPLEVHLNKQMTCLVKTIPSDKLVDINTWGELAIAGGLETQQPPARIAAYYKKQLLNLGLITTDPVPTKVKTIRRPKVKAEVTA